MIGFANYHDDNFGELVVQLQDSGVYVGEIRVSDEYDEEFLNGIQLVVAYIEGLDEMKEFIKEVLINELSETEQERQGNHTRHEKL